MNAINFLRNIFGIDNDESENEKFDNATTPYINPFKKETATEPAEESADNGVEESADMEITLDSRLNDEITEKIIEMINAGLPEYIKNCIDQKAEKEYLGKLFNDTFDRYTSQIKSTIISKAQSQWQSDRINLEQQSHTLGNQIAEGKAKINELREKIASLERQKASLSERSKQQESKIATAEAERDQFQLECKGLMNKLKVQSFSEQELDSIKSENAKLNAELAELRNAAKQKQEIAEGKEDAIAKLQQECEIKDADISYLQAQTKDLESEINRLTNENAILSENCKDLEKAKSLAEALQQKESELSQKITTQQQLIAERDSEISRLSTSISEKKPIIVTFGDEEEIPSAETKSEEAAEPATEYEIPTPKQEEKPAPKAEKRKRTSKKKEERPVVSAIDYTTDYSDWLMPTPPSESIPISNEPEEAEIPVAKEKPRNAPAQMELF